MNNFLAALLLCSVSLSLLALLLRVLRPFLKKRFAAKWLYYAWLFLVLGLLLPVRPALFELPVAHPSAFFQAQRNASGSAGP
ncbi:hypothetical protein [Candidatus Soleaferrea massiliensis]|uniref:hypothetical protein n=1 Tax=Candidatus Soleaferrea massiliensis TaxID=1470354 RepID=UPI00058B33E1|nr:hypothetical protein [Candidatus Soleaferrea massiliensis]